MTITQLSTEDKKNLFDFILKGNTNNENCELEDELNNEFIKEITAYHKHEGNNLDIGILNGKIEYYKDFTYSIFDRDCFANSDINVVQMIKSLITFLGAKKLIFIWIDIKDDIKKELIKAGIKNLICGITLDEQKEEILEIFSDGGMNRYNDNWKTTQSDNVEKYHFRKDSNFKIQIFSLDGIERCKKISISLCEYINNVGGSVCFFCPLYTDKEIDSIARCMGAEKQEKDNSIYYIKENLLITGFNNLVDNKMNFIVQDLGVINESFFNENKEEFCEEDIKKTLIICNTNELEIETLIYIYNKINKSNVLLANSTNKFISTENIKGINKDFIETLDKSSKIKRIEKQDNIIDIRTNRSLFYSLINPHIVANNTSN